MAIQPGTTAPTFNKRGDNGDRIDLGDFKGKKNVLLAFFPGAFTSGCASEMANLNQAIKQFEDQVYDWCESLDDDVYCMCDDIHFISTELFFLYGSHYLKSLGICMNFPVAYNHATRIEDLIKKKDSNNKYIKPVEE